MGLKYFAASAAGNLWESKVTSLFTALTLSVALGFLGVYLALYVNMDAALSAVNERFPLTVYLSDGATAAQTDLIKKRLGSDPSVAGFGYTTKEQALKEFKGSSKEESALIEGLGVNPLPASFDVRLKAKADRKVAEKLAGDLRGMAGVEDVQYLQEEAAKLKSMFESFRLAGLA